MNVSKKYIIKHLKLMTETEDFLKALFSCTNTQALIQKLEDNVESKNNDISKACVTFLFMKDEYPKQFNIEYISKVIEDMLIYNENYFLIYEAIAHDKGFKQNAPTYKVSSVSDLMKVIEDIQSGNITTTEQIDKAFKKDFGLKQRDPNADPEKVFKQETINNLKAVEILVASNEFSLQQEYQQLTDIVTSHLALLPSNSKNKNAEYKTSLSFLQGTGFNFFVKFVETDELFFKATAFSIKELIGKLNTQLDEAASNSFKNQQAN